MRNDDLLRDLSRVLDEHRDREVAVAALERLGRVVDELRQEISLARVSR